MPAELLLVLLLAIVLLLLTILLSHSHSFTLFCPLGFKSLIPANIVAFNGESLAVESV